MGLNVHQGIAAIHTAMSTAFRSGLSSPLAFGIFELFCTRVQHLMSNLWLSLCTDVASSVAARMAPVQISHDRPLHPRVVLREQMPVGSTFQEIQNQGGT